MRHESSNARMHVEVMLPDPANTGLLMEFEEVEMAEPGRNDWEYRLLEATNWELEQMHDVLGELARDGWELDAAYSGDDNSTAPAGLHLWLKRPAGSRVAA